MGVFKNEYYLHSEKSKKELYESNLINFRNERYIGKITEDGFKVIKRRRVQPLRMRSSPYQGVFIGKITETENGCDIKLISRINYFFLTTMMVIINTHVIFPTLLWLIFLISGNSVNEIVSFPTLGLIVISILWIALYFAPRKGEEELVKNILTLKPYGIFTEK